jgi:hypothetical protein
MGMAQFPSLVIDLNKKQPNGLFQAASPLVVISTALPCGSSGLRLALHTNLPVERSGKEKAMLQQRVYLVIMDETDEARQALRFAARRAVRTDGTVHILALVPKQEFVAFAGVQATIEEEAKDRAEVLVTTAAGSVASESGLTPIISVRQGNGPDVVRDYLREHPEVSALVLGAAADGAPGPMITHFSTHAGQLPCPLMIVPGGMDDEAIDALS